MFFFGKYFSMFGSRQTFRYVTLYPFSWSRLRNKLFMVLKMENTFLFPAGWSNWTFCNSQGKTSSFWDYLAEREYVLGYEIGAQRLFLDSIWIEVFSPNVNCFPWRDKLALVFLVINYSDNSCLFTLCMALTIEVWRWERWWVRRWVWRTVSVMNWEGKLSATFLWLLILREQEGIISQGQPCRFASP